MMVISIMIGDINMTICSGRQRILIMKTINGAIVRNGDSFAALKAA